MKKGNPVWAGICVLLLSLLCAGCGQEDYAVGSASLEYYDIAAEKEELFEGRDEEEESGFLLGMQYYQGEPVQIWLSFEEEKRNVYLCRTDGSRELLEEDVQGTAVSERWYAAGDGSVYCWKRSMGANIGGGDIAYIRKLDDTGKELFYKELERDILLWDLCQLEDGRILLLIQEGLGGDMKVAELNPANGSLSEKPGVRLGQTVYSMYIASGEQGVLVLEAGYPEGLSEISMANGNVLSAISFLGTSYSMEDNSEEIDVWDFRMLEDGTVEILWADMISGRGIRETLSLFKIEKTPVILQTTLLMDGGWLETQAAKFNQENSSYQVIIEYPDPTDQVDFGKRLAVQMTTGKGPDILYGYALEFVYDMVEKGGFEDLAPYMEESGIREEDYFPYAFSCWRDGEKIYTYRMRATPYFSAIKKELLGEQEISDIGTLLDALLDWEGEGFFNLSLTSSSVLKNFFDSKDFWGMIDLENGTCDLSGELFAKILKVAKKYGLSYEKAVAGDFPIGTMFVKEGISCDLYDYKTSAELEEMGLVNMETLLGMGGYPLVSSGVNSCFAVNASSVQKEGAWEFLCYIMSEKVQSTLTGTNTTNKQIYMEWLEQELERLQNVEGAIGVDDSSTMTLSNGEMIVIKERTIYTKEDITQERIEEYLDMRENAGEMLTMEYMRLKPVYDIILEEAEYYFSDAKSLEEVVDIINSRVGIYVWELH